FVDGTSSNVFSYDNAAATSSVSVPVNHGAYRTFTNLSGGAGDDFSGVGEVRLTISYLSAGDTWYWMGTYFSSGTYTTVQSSVTVQYAPAATWSYDATALASALANGQQYT